MPVTITAIDTVPIRIPLDIWAPPPVTHGLPRTHVEALYVRVTTSAGVVGWGESLGSGRALVITAIDNWLKRLTVGQDVNDTTLLPRIERMLVSLGRSGPVMSGIGALDIALWDIRGKLEGVPVSTLLGGKKRARVACYASLMQYYNDLEHVKRNSARALEHGFRQIKLHEKTPESVAAARATIGPDIPLMVDTNCAWTPQEATAPVAAMAESKPYWVEEPIWPPEDFDALAKLRKTTGVPLAMGENATSPSEFRTMVATGATDFVQPSIVKVGITHMARVAAETDKSGKALCVPNAFYIGPGYLAVLHCLAVKEREAPLERMFCQLGGTPYAKTVPVVNGAVEVPDRPGLGADPEEDLIAQFRV